MKKRDLGIALMTVGGLLIPVLLCCGAITVTGLLDPEETEPGTWIGIALCFIGPLFFLIAGALAGGYALIRQDREELLHRTVLRLAEENDGRVTAHEVALHSTLTIEAAQRYLDRLAAQGLCGMDYTENGTISYRFWRPDEPAAPRTDE